MTTGSGAVIIERHYRAKDAHYPRRAKLVIDGCEEHAGISDPILTKPIDFEAEIAERRDTHQPIRPVETDLTNSVFGI